MTSAAVPAGTPVDRTGTRGRILEVSLRLFAEHGYAGTSVRDIAEQLGITKAAVHYHFSAKEQIAVALLEPFFDRLSEAVESVPPGAPRELLLALRAVLEEHGPLLQVLTRDPSLAEASGDLHCAADDMAERSAARMAGPDADAVRVVRAHAALGAFFAGTAKTVERGLGPEVHDQVVEAALAALGAPVSPGGAPSSRTPAAAG